MCRGRQRHFFTMCRHFTRGKWKSESENLMLCRSGSVVSSSSAEDMKARVMSRIKDTNISNIFNRKK
ncbi:hypothetical protein ACOMHN_011040 [Nucella lapillus]